MKFRLIGRTLNFNATSFYTIIGIACVEGVSIDGKYRTRARIEDVIFL